MSGVELAGGWPQAPKVSEVETDFETVSFPTAALPGVVKTYCDEVCRVTQAPLELVAPACIGLLSACLGKGVVIPNARSGMKGLPTLQFMIALESGSGKTTVFSHVFAPFQRWCKEQRTESKRHASTISAKTKLLEREIQKLVNEMGGDLEIVRKQQELDALKREAVPPEYWVEDITPEALAVQLGANGTNGQEAVFMLSDDPRKAIATLLGRYNQGGGADDSLLVKGFSWSPHQQHRRKEGGSVNLDAPCVSLFATPQPDLLDRLMDSPELFSSGCLQRLMLDEVECPARKDGEHYEIDAVVRAEWDLLVNVLLNTFRLAINPNEVRVSDEARSVLKAYRNELVDRINDPLDLRDVRSFADRWAEWAWRLALVTHVTVHRREAMDEPICLKTAEDAVGLAKYYASRKLAILAGIRTARASDIKARILNLALSRDYLVAADLQTSRLARSAQEARAYLDRMVGEGSLVFVEREAVHTKPDPRTGLIGKGGPISRRYYLTQKAPTYPAINAINAINAKDEEPVGVS